MSEKRIIAVKVYEFAENVKERKKFSFTYGQIKKNDV